MDRKTFMQVVNNYIKTLDIDEHDKRLIMRRVMNYVNSKSEFSERDLMFIKSVEIPSVIWRGF